MNRYRPLSAAALLAAALAVAVLPAAPASAHTELKSTTPAAKSTTTRPVAEVTLTFTGLVKKPGTTVAVTGPDKTSYSSGDAEVLDRTITQKVDALPVGAITVAWRTVAADGHPMQGSFTFTNRAAPPTPSAEPSPSPSAVPTTAPPTSAAAPTPVGQASDDDSSSSPVVWVVVAAVVLAAAALGGVLWRRRRSGT
ncbi:copper resistance protein CopC [Phytohabitans sp. ZYX-F-186]|uniref:Copper resistance protein CopC n=1 Tax=Phytohabitans maris TaxID=3071409 RepID=A0ABU0ZQT1_9ACTN|nr:copper resistance protein CopC [Phytohabitans sp. ZYX-F-186]MDQ7909393.1 copper resistance protein CopC [Phytohabitans sp. ZYX-F-186]